MKDTNNNLKDKVKMDLTNFLAFIGIFSLIEIIAVLSELFIHKNIQFNPINNVLISFLSISLYYNYKNWIKER
ncbi:hypothetical protein [Clostridium rectalis]|uniref:hypothetical protein n=1 Tax=Clostridium rectalis TaxID=2040295 RepID=UPI000F636A2E|nr:hypothetical protein [Clostridium rectalis]